jgi:hypothetical protein
MPKRLGHSVSSRGSVFQFKVTLADIEPSVWRRIQVSGDATFWALHVAIQDAFGWEDRHLHEFRVPARGGSVRLGIPDPSGFDENPPLADWTVALGEYIRTVGQEFVYTYDFGDDWRHVVTFEGQVAAEPRKRYPRLVDGANACPPEDVGGPPGYFEFLEALHNSAHVRHQEFKSWIGRPFDPSMFDARRVRFDDPNERLVEAGLVRQAPRLRKKTRV